jgi:hypothetical protein
VDKKLKKKAPSSLIIVKGSLTGGCIEGRRICVGEELLGACGDGKLRRCREAPSPAGAMALLREGEGILLPGWLSWTEGFEGEDEFVKHFPIEDDASRVHWWYLSVTKTSARRIEAANAILQMTQDTRVKDVIKKAGYIAAPGPESIGARSRQ